MRRLFAALALLVLAATAARAEIAVPPPGLVVDQVGVLTPEARTDLEELLIAVRGASHPAAIAILVIDHVPDGDIESYALAVGRAWKLGRAGIDDGLLLVHAVGDHRYRFEVGPGLQGVLPDGAIGDIGRQFFVPWIKAGEPHRAYRESVLAITERLGNAEAAGTAVAPSAEAVAVTPAPAPADEQAAPLPADDTGFYTGLAVVVAIVVLSIVLRRSYLLAAGGSAALTAGTMTLFAQQIYDIVTFSLAASVFGAFMVLMARHPSQALGFFFDIVLNALTRSSSSSSSSGSSGSSSFGGGSFDGGGASGSTD